MSTSLTKKAEQAIISLGHVFNVHTYARQVWLSDDESRLQEEMAARYQKIRGGGHFWLRPEDNFVVNLYLHRMFHHRGYLPEARSPEWYEMVLLYLHLYRVPVLGAHRHNTSYPDWAGRPKGSAEATASEIRLLLSRPS